MKVKNLFFNFFILTNSIGIFINQSAQAQVIAGGYRHSLFVCSNNIVMGLGSNISGQLGIGSASNFESNPVQVSNLDNIIDVAAGRSHSLFLKSDGTAWACGANASGQLGDGTITQRLSPVMVIGLSDIIKISAKNGDYSLFLKSDGTVWACGNNSFGQLGDGTQINRDTPVQIIGLTNIADISAGEFHSLFVKSDGTVWACGRNDNGQLGNGSIANSLTAIQIPGLININAVAAGQLHSLFLNNVGNVWACGFNFFGQLGDGTTNSSLIPIQVNNLTGIISIDACDSRSHFLRNNGTAWGCGNNNFYALGSPSPSVATIPIQAVGLTDVSELAAGFTHSLFRKDNGSVFACGENTFGQINTGSASTSVPALVNGLCTVLSIPNEQLEIVNSLELFPNPVVDKLVIWRLSEHAEININNVAGQRVLEITLTGAENKIDVSNLKCGIYFISVNTDDKVSMSRFIKQ